MNKEVKDSLAEVIKAWKTGERKFTFESRGFAGFMMSPIVKGEAIMRFHISIDGFFEDDHCSKPINLSSGSGLFFTQLLSQEKPDNPNADSIRLKAFLEDFTASAYNYVERILSSYPQTFTSDPLFM